MSHGLNVVERLLPPLWMGGGGGERRENSPHELNKKVLLIGMVNILHYV